MKYETFAKRLGKGLAHTRQQKKMTQSRLARVSGLSLKYVSMMELGTNPSLRTVMKVCEALGTDLTDVMEQEGIGTLPGKRSTKLRDVQVDIPSNDPQMKKLLGFIRRLEPDDMRRALRLVKTTFGDG